MKPLERIALEGRTNPKGIPYLYLSSKKETAMSEVRPWIGGYISLGLFSTTKELRLIDLSTGDNRLMFHFTEPPPQKREEAVWSQVNRSFSYPVSPSDDKADYVATQIIAELFKKEGYDGVIYRSSFGGSGYNLALFDLISAQLLNCQLHEAKSFSITFEEFGNPYFMKEENGERMAMRNKIVDIRPIEEPEEKS